MAHSELRRALDVLGAGKGASRVPLIADYYSFQSLPYYEKWHPARADLGRYRRFRAMTVNDVRVLLGKQKAPEAWVLVSRLEFVAPTRRLLIETCASLELVDIGEHHVLARCELAPIRGG
jgi:hypothetical protein